MSRSRRLLLLPLMLAWGCGSGQEPPSAAPVSQTAGSSRPLNFIVITLDTVRADALGAYGQKLPSSPRIDAMAADGLLFEQALTSAPSTLPAHASLFTGKHPYAHGVRSNFGYTLPEDNVTLAEILRSRGYSTAAEVAAPVLARGRKLEQGFGTYRDPGKTTTVLDRFEAIEGGHKRLLRPAEEITRAGLEFLRRHADRPFLLWLHYFDAHRPYAELPQFLRQVSGDPYHAEVARVDDAVGRIVDEIQRLGLRESTVIVVTADHGEGNGDHAEYSHSFLVYDSTMHIPLIFWGADVVPRAQRVASLVRLVDVAPTILDLVDAPLPPGIQGVSLLPLFRHARKDLGLTGYGESIEPMVNFGSSPLRFVREGRWKYIHKLHPELYDVNADPGEVRNLYAEHPAEIDRLRARLASLIAASPETPGGSEVEMDAETLSQLHALGYVGGPATAGLDDEAASLEVHGPDPLTRIDDIWKLSVGWGHLGARRYGEAEALFREVVDRNPESVSPLYALITAVSSEPGREREVEELLRHLIELDPESVTAKSDLAKSLRERGDLDGAYSLFRQALSLDECSVRVRLLLSELLRERKRYAEQVALLEAGDDSCFNSVVVRNALAYALATSPDAAVRDGERSLPLALAAVEETEASHPDYLDSLACAYAELGQFEPAVRAQKKALALLAQHDVVPEVAEIYRSHLDRFEAGEVVREP